MGCPWCQHQLFDRSVRDDGIPEAGKIVGTRDPADLAAALAAVCDAPRPSRDVLARLVTPFEPRHCAKAYLDWFDALGKNRHG